MKVLSVKECQGSKEAGTADGNVGGGKQDQEGGGVAAGRGVGEANEGKKVNNHGRYTLKEKSVGEDLSGEHMKTPYPPLVEEEAGSPPSMMKSYTHIITAT